MHIKPIRKENGTRFIAGCRNYWLLGALLERQQHLTTAAVEVDREDPCLERHDDAPRLLVPHAWPEDDAPTAFLTDVDSHLKRYA